MSGDLPVEGDAADSDVAVTSASPSPDQARPRIDTASAEAVAATPEVVARTEVVSGPAGESETVIDDLPVVTAVVPVPSMPPPPVAVQPAIEPQPVEPAGARPPPATAVEGTPKHEHLAAPRRLFDEQHAEYLTARAVPLDLAYAAGIRSTTGEIAARALQREHPIDCPCLGILYPGPQPPYMRVRLDDPDVAGGARYLAPAGREVPIYVPQVPVPKFAMVNKVGAKTEPPVEPAAGQPSTELPATGPAPAESAAGVPVPLAPPALLTGVLTVVESPIKALSILATGVGSVGLGGTSTTLTGKDHERRLNDSWKSVSLNGQEVIVVFDAGRATNANVARDEARLVLALIKAGAKVKVAALPLTSDGADRGPDDFIATEGAKAFWDVLALASPAGPVERAEAVAAVNDPKVNAALVDDLPFLVSVISASAGSQRLVASDLLKAGIKATEFKKLLAATAARMKSSTTASSDKKKNIGDVEFDVTDGCISTVTWKMNEDGDYEQDSTLLANFTAVIDEEIVIDDGVEETRELVLQGRLADGGVLPRSRMAVTAFKDHLWAQELWGVQVQTATDQSTAAQLRLAIQQRSAPKQVRIYSSAGWRQLRDQAGEPSGFPVFLHAGGAVGADGVQVSLTDTLERYRLPAVPVDPVEAVLISVSLLELAARVVTVPLFAATYRAPLQSLLYGDFTTCPIGKSGTQKTTVTNVFASHFGEGLEHVSAANWHDTAASIENKLFLAKDCLVVIDDFAPKGNTGYDQLHAKAEIIIRSIGNRSARGRMRADLTARASRPPQALVVSTGEDAPQGESIRARTVPLFFTPNTVNLKLLSAAQRQVPRLAHAMTAYLGWLRPRMNGLGVQLGERFRYWRDQFHTDGCHLRSPSSLAHLAAGLEMFGDFATDIGALTPGKAKRLVADGVEALATLGSGQKQNVEEIDPPTHFIDVLRDLVVQGKAILRADLNAPLAEAPLIPASHAYGADSSRNQQREQEKGAPIGWRSAHEVFLLKDVTFRAVVEAISGMRETFPLAQATLWRRLRDAGRIQHGDRGDRLTCRKGLGGIDRVEVIVMPIATLFPADPPQSSGAGPAKSSTQTQNMRAEENDEYWGEDGPPQPAQGATNGPIEAPDPAQAIVDGLLGATGARQTSAAPENGSRRTAPAIGPEGPNNRPAPDTNRTKPEGAEEEKKKERIEITHTPPPPSSGLRRLGRMTEEVDGLVEGGPVEAEGVGEKHRDIGALVSLPGRTRPTGPTGPATFFLEPGAAYPSSWSQPATSGSIIVQPPGSGHVVAHGVKPALRRWGLMGFTAASVRCTQTAIRLLTGITEKKASFDELCRNYLPKGVPPSVEQLDVRLRSELKLAGLERVAALEFELLPVVARMENVGVGVDAAAWTNMVAQRRATGAELREAVRTSLKIENPDDNEEVLVALKAKGLAITQTAGDVLYRHVGTLGVAEFLEYRRIAAFLNDLGAKVLELVSQPQYRGCIQATLDPLGASTGRMTCTAPNLLGLEKDPEVRRCVVPAKDMVFVVADYAAIELRVLAHVTGDESLRGVFQRGGDPHRHTASLILAKPDADVTNEERERAKPVNFGLAFGMGDQGLVDHAASKYGVTITLQEAKQFRAAYLKAYPKVAAWQQKMKMDAPTDVRTASGRRRIFKSKTSAYCERLATEVQGSAADGMKRAMVLLDRRLAAFGARIVLCVHDELLVEAPADRAEEVLEVVVAGMVEGMAEFITSVPLVVEASIRRTWAVEDVVPIEPIEMFPPTMPVATRKGTVQLSMFRERADRPQGAA